MSYLLNSAFHRLKRILVTREKFAWIAGLVLLGEVVLNLVIIQYVKYTEIDWVAYTQQIRGFSNGERNYLKLRGDTGPLV